MTSHLKRFSIKLYFSNFADVIPHPVYLPKCTDMITWMSPTTFRCQFEDLIALPKHHNPSKRIEWELHGRNRHDGDTYACEVKISEWPLPPIQYNITTYHQYKYWLRISFTFFQHITTRPRLRKNAKTNNFRLHYEEITS